MVLDSKLRELFRSLASELEAEVTRRNKPGGNPGERVQYHYDPEGKVLVTRRGFPSLDLNVWADESARLLRYSYARKKDKNSDPQQGPPGQFRVLEIAGGGLLLVTGERKISLEDAARLLLEPFDS